MNDLKYKAWDKQYKKIVNVTMILFNTEELDHDDNLGEPKSWEHFDIMRFTGIHDVNGAEIYAGHIVSDKTNKTMEVIYRPDACQFWLITKEGDKKRFKPLRATFSDGEYLSNTNIEILGNIYQNINLIK